jgi:hypothetical protein
LAEGVIYNKTPINRRLVFFGDVEETVRSMRPTAKRLRSKRLGGGIDGGVITYTANGAPKVRWPLISYSPFGRFRRSYF